MKSMGVMLDQTADALLAAAFSEIEPPAPEPGDDEAAFAAKAKAFVEKYAPNFKARPIFVVDFGHPHAYKDDIYKAGRIALA